MNSPDDEILERQAAQRAAVPFQTAMDSNTWTFLKHWPILTVFLCAFLLFVPTLGHKLVWDDQRFIQYAEDVVAEEGIVGLVTREYRPDLTGGPETGYYRPVSLSSLWLDNQLGASSPVTFHLTNVLLHAFCSVLVFVLLRMVVPFRTGALGGALLFAVHPIHVESVAFVSGRTDVLVNLFVLISVILWMRVYKGETKNPFRDLLLSLMAFSVACLSKEISLVLPLVLLTWSFIRPFDRSTGSSTSRKLIHGWSLASVAIVFVIVLLRYFILDIGFGRGLVPMSTGVHGLNMLPRNMMLYGRLLIFPWPLRPYYWTQGLEIRQVEILTLLLTGMICYFFKGKNRKFGLAAAIWIVVFILPVSGVVPIHGSPLAERYLYISSVGFCFLMAELWGRLYELYRYKSVVTILGVALLIPLAVGTYSYSKAWRDDVTLYSEMVIKEPEAVIGYFNLGNTYKSVGQLEGAEWAYRQAIAVEPRFGGSRINLLGLYLEEGKCAKAGEVYEEALSGFAGKPDDLYALIMALSQFGTVDATTAPLNELRLIDAQRADEALWALSETAIIDTFCFRSGWLTLQ